MKKNRGCLVFDGDNTLWFNQYKYNILRTKCLEIIAKDLGIYCLQPAKILQIFEDIDAESVKTRGHDKSRFPTSWAQTYQKICQELQIKPKKKIAEKLYRVASKFWQPPFPLRKGVKKILKTLRKRGFYLILLTLGDPEVQEKKINITGLRKYFDDVKIVTAGKVEVLQELAKKFGKTKTWMIGDSKKSDITAALTAKIRAIYLLNGSNWIYNDFDCGPDYKYVIEIKNLEELLQIFPEKTN